MLALAAAAACAPGRADTDGLAARLAAARAHAAADPRGVVHELELVRRDALGVGDLAARLAADELECRAMSDLDQAQALRAADAGLAAAGAAPPSAAQPAWLRLRSCRAGALFDLGESQRATAELADVLARAAALGEAGTAARGTALLERGVDRSRRGEMVQGQNDLLAACGLLKEQGTAADQDLCVYHLSSHYRRIGDADEALRLLQDLHARAQRSGAWYDDSVYVYAIGSVQMTQSRWTEALASFQQSLSVGARFQDTLGVAYAEHGVARALLRLDRPREAIPHVGRALALGDAAADPREGMLRAITLAEAQAATGQAAEARRGLDRIAPRVRTAGNATVLAQWLAVRAEALSALGQWKDARDALVEARAVEGRLHAQQLSEHSARLRMQFNRDRDAEELDTLRRLNEQGRQLRQTQALALGLFVVLLVAALVLAVRKVRQARHLKRLALTDELTGLPNRRALFAHAHDALAACRAGGAAMAVLMVDVDHFKRINDGHGHAVGDAVLRHLAQVLGGLLRGQDRLGRVGGEEFVAVLPGAAVAEARQVAERMRAAACGAPLTGAAEGPIAFSVSIGVAAFEDDATLEALLSRADAALYRAKAEGRNRVCVAGELPPDDAQANDSTGQPRSAATAASRASGSTATGCATADSSGRSLIESL